MFIWEIRISYFDDIIFYYFQYCLIAIRIMISFKLHCEGKLKKFSIADGPALADAYQSVDNVMGNALNVVFQLSSWFAEYETAPFTNIGDIGQDGVSYMPGLSSSNQC